MKLTKLSNCRMCKMLLVLVVCMSTMAVKAQTVTIGTGTNLTGAIDDVTAFGNRWPTFHMQLLYTAAELTTAGVQPGNITAIGFNVSTLGDAATNANYTVKIGASSLTALSSPFISTTGFTTVFPSATFTHAVGWNTINFSPSYSWNGTSGILIDITYSGADQSNNARTYYTNTTNNSVLAAHGASGSTAAYKTRPNIMITYSLPCSGTPAAGSVTPAAITKCSGQTQTLSATGTSSASGVSFQWQVSTTAGGPYSNVTGGSGATTPNYTTDILNTGTYYYVLKSTCSDGSTAALSNEVALTVNQIPTVSVTPTSSTICSGQSVALNASGADAYTWSPATGLDVTNGATVNASPTSSGNYTVTGITNGCSATATSDITVNLTPSAVSIIPSGSTNLCSGSVQQLTASGGDINGAVILTENFNAVTNNWTTGNTSTGTTPANVAWTLRPDGYNYSSGGGITVHSNDNSQVYMTIADPGGSGTLAHTTLSSPAFSTINFTSASVNFYHHLKYGSGIYIDSGRVQVSLDNTTWETLQSYIADVGTGTAFANASVSLPATYLNKPTVYVRFSFDGGWGYWWIIDNVSITGSQTAAFAWSPVPDLYTDAAATTAYAGENINTVYAKPNASTAYTATATSLAGCASSAIVNVNVTLPSPPIAVSPEDTAVCAGNTMALSATAGGASGASNGSSGTINLAIPDNSATGVSNAINLSDIPTGATIDSIIVTVNIAQTYDGDVELNLQAPNGETVNILADQGSTGDNFTNTRLTSDLTAAAITTGSTGAPFTGTYKMNLANSNLINTTSVTTTNVSDLYSMPNGIWTLQAYDDANGDVGILNNWSIKIAYTLPPMLAVWSPATDLYEDAAATIPYSGDPIANVYAKPSGNITYTATHTDACNNSSDSVKLTVIDLSAVTADSTNPTGCTSNDGSIAIIGLTPDYSFTLNYKKGGVAQTANTITSDASGNYNISGLGEGSYSDIIFSTTSGCSSAAFTATLSNPPLPSVSAVANNIVCEGSDVILTGTTDGNTYSWSGPNGFTSSNLEETIPAIGTNGSGVYVFTATNIATNCSANASTTIAVNPLPSAVAITPADSVAICAGAIEQLTVSGGTNSNIPILSQDFNAATNDWVIGNTTTGSSTPANVSWTLRPDGYNYTGGGGVTVNSNDNTQFYFANADAGGSGTKAHTTLQSPTFSTAGFSSASINFYHYLKAGSGTYVDTGRVQASNDNGATWQTLQEYNSNVGSANSFVSASVALPAAYLNQPSVLVRFSFDGTWAYFWAIDNVSVSGDQSATISWSPATDLYTDAAATTAYAGEDVTTVYAKSLAEITYTATATSPTGCTASDTVKVKVNAKPELNVTTMDNMDCNTPNGMIHIDATPAFVENQTYNVYYNDAPQGTATVNSSNELVIENLNAGNFTSIYIDSTGGCSSDTIASVTVGGLSSNGDLATTTSSGNNAQPSGTVNYNNSSCELITTINATNGDLGNVTANVNILGSVGTYNNEFYIGRVYNLEATNNVGATLTLYFTDAEINDYNTAVGSSNATFPQVATDGSNLMITAFHSTAGAGTGPLGYDTTTSELITPSSYVHNVAEGRYEVTFAVGGFSGFFSNTNSDAPLPIRMGNISAINMGASNRVDWDTKEEAEGDHFTIERSADAKSFIAIGSVDAKGLANSRYSFMDVQPYTGINYYRLLITNNDGSKYYSRTVNATVAAKDLVIDAFPNPVSDQLTVRANGIVEGKGEIVLLDAAGRVISKAGIESNSSTVISMSQLAQGMYLIKFTDANTTRTIKVNKK